MPRAAKDTRARILDAAMEEFAAHGLAGGRMQRISERSSANPSSIYSYFGSKEALFGAAVTAAIGELARTDPLDPSDLAGSVVRWSDWAIEHPQAVRLATWRRLEAPDVGPDDQEAYRRLAGEISASSQRPADALPAADVLLLVLNLVLAYTSGSPDVQGIDPRPLEDLQRRQQFRASLHEAVRRVADEPLT